MAWPEDGLSYMYKAEYSVFAKQQVSLFIVGGAEWKHMIYWDIAWLDTWL